MEVVGGCCSSACGKGRAPGQAQPLSCETSPAVSQIRLSPGNYPRVRVKGQRVSANPLFLFSLSVSHLSQSRYLCSMFTLPVCSQASQSIFLF